MGKIKLIFSLLTVIISIFFIIISFKFEQKIDPLKYTTPTFQIIEISENSKLFRDLDLKKPLTVSSKSFSGDLRIKTDSQASFRFIFNGTIFHVLPNSYVYYDTKKEKLSFLSGEMFWSKVTKTSVTIYTTETGNPLTISNSGKISRHNEGNLQIWNFNGSSILNRGEELIKIPSDNYFVLDTKSKYRFSEIPEATTFIAPKEKDLYIKKIIDFLIKLDWKNVNGVSEYNVKLYTSPLRDNLLLEKKVALNRTGVDVIEFEQIREFYWEVIPLNKDGIEGEPSEMGHIKLHGILVNSEGDNRPPKLEISSLTVNGNMVLIRGKGEINAELFINNSPVKIDNNGVFIYTVKFKTLGLKEITFKLVSPSGSETTQTKQVTIYEE